MPYVLWNIHTVSSALRADNTGSDNFSLVVVGRDSDLAFQDDKGLVLVRMVVHGNVCTRLQSIDEAVAFVLKAFMEVIVHSQSW